MPSFRAIPADAPYYVAAAIGGGLGWFASGWLNDVTYGTAHPFAGVFVGATLAVIVLYTVGQRRVDVLVVLGASLVVGAYTVVVEMRDAPDPGFGDPTVPIWTMFAFGSFVAFIFGYACIAAWQFWRGLSLGAE